MRKRSKKCIGIITFQPSDGSIRGRLWIQREQPHSPHRKHSAAGTDEAAGNRSGGGRRKHRFGLQRIR